MNMSVFKKIFVRMMSGLLVMLSVISGIAFARFYVVPPEVSTTIEPAVQGRTNILCLATDAGGLLTDTIMVVSLDSSRKLINILSIPRDTRVNISGFGYQKINSAYAFGRKDERHEATIKCVKEIVGLPINYYAVIGPNSFRDIVDALGGVWFDVPQRMRYSDPVQKLYIDLYPGEQLLDGDKAEQLTRFRGYPNADLGRVETQQKFVSALFEQKLKPEYIMKSPEIYTKLSNSISTNVRVSDFPVFTQFLGMISKDAMQTFELPGGAQTISGISYFVYDAAATKELVQQEFLGIKPESDTFEDDESVEE